MAPLHYAQMQPLIIDKSTDKFWGVYEAIFVQRWCKLAPKDVQNGAAMPLKQLGHIMLGAFWAIFGLFGPFWPVWALWAPFWGPFGAPKGLLALFGPLWGPQRASGARKVRGDWPKWAKSGSRGDKNVFWDRFRPFGDHFSAFPVESENQFFFEISTIVGHLGPFFGPFWPFGDPFWVPKGPREPQK